MKIINTRVLVPEEVKLDKVKHANLVVTYEGRDGNEYRYVSMPFMLSDSADKIKEARDTLLRLRHEVGYIRKKDIEDAFAGIVEDKK